MGSFYTEKSNQDFNYTNRYRKCNILTDNETHESLLATREIEDIKRTTENVYHRLESHECNRLDLIAYKYYQNPSLWWVIAQANDIYDPFIEMEPGTLLRIPDIESLYGSKGLLL